MRNEPLTTLVGAADELGWVLADGLVDGDDGHSYSYLQV